MIKLIMSETNQATDVVTDKSSSVKPEVALNKVESKSSSRMQDLLNDTPGLPQPDEVVEGTISAIGRAKIYIDLPPFGTGLIYGREFLNARDILRKVSIGDTIAAKVIDTDNEDGYIELSLREARQALIWSDAEKFVKTKQIMSLEVQEANKGGLIIKWQGITGFLPASQLSAENYPRVEDGDKDKILTALNDLVGKFLNVTMIVADKDEGKLIFSEKESHDQKNKEVKVKRYEVGDVLSGKITGAVDFGVFVKLEEGLEGLVHISELDWGLVENTRNLFKIGDQVKVKVIEVKDDKISLSIKQLLENPWVEAAKKYKRGQKIDGVVIKYNKHGALASVEEGVAGLVHISEFESEEALRNTLSLGNIYQFTITLFEPNEQRMTLQYKPVKKT